MTAITTGLPTGSAFELLENGLLAFVLAGVFWNVLEGYGAIPGRVVPVAIVLTLLLLFALFSIETVGRRFAADRPR